MKKYVIGLGVLFVILALIGWRMMAGPNDKAAETATTTPDVIITASTTKPVVTTPSTPSEKDQAWMVFQNYLNFAKAKNLQGVASLSYQLSDDCHTANADYSTSKNPATKAKCEEKMWSVYLIGSEFKKADFVNISSDQKQIILSTNFFRADVEGIAGLIHSSIYFVKDNGTLKILSFTPGKGAFMDKTASTTEAEITKNLNEKVLDSDKDGLSNAEENCTGLEATTCLKTDPNKRDTNGNGYWDGIEALFYK